MKLRYLLMPLVLSSSSVVMAATNGSLNSSSSSGSTDVTISITDLVQVTVEQDVALTAYSPGSNSTGNTRICIYHRGANTAGLTLTSTYDNNNGGANATEFNMSSDGGTTRLPYLVQISSTSFTSGTKQTGWAANQASTNCSGGWNHQIDITAQSADLDAAPAGNFTDTMTILVEPT